MFIVRLKAPVILSWISTTKDNQGKNDKRAVMFTLEGSKELSLTLYDIMTMFFLVYETFGINERSVTDSNDKCVV